MNIATKKRHQSLQPLSRDHGVGLLCAQHGQKAIRASLHDRLELTEQIRVLSQVAVLSYLQDEQRVLSSLIEDDVLRTEFQQHHNNIRELIYRLDLVEPSVDPGIGLLASIAAALESYVRWEENALFPMLEQTLGYQVLCELTGLTELIESDRARPTQLLHQSISLDISSGLPLNPDRQNQ
jgi:iron-sulfur cluster repair protein YtfE (RIC family)